LCEDEYDFEAFAVSDKSSVAACNYFHTFGIGVGGVGKCLANYFVELFFYDTFKAE